MSIRQHVLTWTQDLSSGYNPLRTWILQLVLIMTLTQILYQLLKRSRQPRVIAEILAGILLSPSALGRIPGFTETFFPEISRPYLSLIADIGLILFLFLVGLEIDGSLIRKSASLSASIALGGIILPFGLGSALSVPLYNRYVDSGVEFTHFFLFIGIAFSITAFPVLCRILTELKLLDTTVGVIVLSVGVLNDIFGWILLALSLTLARSTSSLSALWILLYAVAWVFFLFYPVRRAFFWLAHWTGSVNNGPSILFMTISILTMFCSAFFTDLIGVHAIFGSFLVGLIIPREGGLAITLTEKLEDMVSIIFLPLYFTASGLSTDFGLLNNGVTWMFTLAIIVLAWTGKFGGGLLAARICGFQWREAASIGTLLSCKGLIELIVLNVGLSAGIINKTVFSMFVLEALTLTFLTTPLVTTIYPPERRKKPSHGNFMSPEDAEQTVIRPCGLDIRQKSLITVVLDRIDSLPSVMSFIELFIDRVISNESNAYGTHSTRSSSILSSGLSVKALRLIELSERSSDVMRSSVTEELLATDPLLKILRAYCNINNIDVSASLSIIPLEELASKVAESTSGHSSELVLIPCPRFHLHHSAEILSQPLIDIDDATDHPTLIGSSLHFLREVLSKCVTDSIILFERRTDPIDYRSDYHFIFPFFGGEHDRLALRLVLQLCAKKGTTATVIQIRPPEITRNKQTNIKTSDSLDGVDSGLDFSQPESSVNRDQERNIDDDLWSEFTTKGDFRTETQNALQRIDFQEKTMALTLSNVFSQVHLEIGNALSRRSKRPCIILGHESGRRIPRGNFSDSGEASDGAWRDTTVKVSPDVVTTIGVFPSVILAKTDEKVGLMVVRSGYKTVV